MKDDLMGDGSATIAPVSEETVIQPITPASEEDRCEHCGWPIVPEGESGCWKSNCSMRPMPPKRPKQCEISALQEGELRLKICEAIRSPRFGRFSSGEPEQLDLILKVIRPYLLSPPFDIEAGAIACSQWVYGVNHGKPSWDRLSEEHREQYREQAKACARAWGLKHED